MGTTTPDTTTVTPATRAGLEAAEDALRRGGLVGLPTETVYGVAAWGRSEAGVARLRALKVEGRREAFTVHVGDVAQAGPLLEAAPAAARRLVRRAMPGPLTLLIELEPARAEAVARAMGIGDALLDAVIRADTIGVRCPSHPATAALLAAMPTPVLMSSAHRPGDRAAVEPDDTARRLGDAADLVIDGGRSRFASPSTVVRFPRATGRGRVDYRLERVGVYDGRMVQDMSRATVLFVCSGNTCRSPMAEAIAASMLAEAGGGARASSAGVMAMPGAPASEGAVRALEPMGVALGGHRSSPLSRERIAGADAVYTMTRAHLDAVLEMAPEAAEKVKRLDPDHDVLDPIGSGDEVYRETAQMIRDAVERRLAEEGLIA